MGESARGQEKTGHESRSIRPDSAHLPAKRPDKLVILIWCPDGDPQTSGKKAALWMQVLDEDTLTSQTVENPLNLVGIEFQQKKVGARFKDPDAGKASERLKHFLAVFQNLSDLIIQHL